MTVCCREDNSTGRRPHGPQPASVSRKGPGFRTERTVLCSGQIFSYDFLAREALNKKQDHVYPHENTFNKKLNLYPDKHYISIAHSPNSATPQVACWAPESLKSRPTGPQADTSKVPRLKSDRVLSQGWISRKRQRWHCVSSTTKMILSKNLSLGLKIHF